MNTIAITGASGFLGKHLVAAAIRSGNWRIRILSRSNEKSAHMDFSAFGVEVVYGDMRDSKSLRELIEPDCTVVNLVYLWNAGEAENLSACGGLLEACKAANIRRLIHCSTASVVGRTADDLVTENTPCRPITEYGITKLAVERAILEAARGCFEATILRPAAVFGSDGENLKKIADDLTNGKRIRNYLRSCLFGTRRMNLVCVENVVHSILFLAGYGSRLGGEVFNISDDDSPLNNFAHIERALMRALGIPDYSLPRIAVPPSMLSLLLELRRRDNVNPYCNYSSEKLIGYGFSRPVSFETGLAEYAAWYRSAHPVARQASS